MTAAEKSIIIVILKSVLVRIFSFMEQEEALWESENRMEDLLWRLNL